jgi:lipopolysaccharide/colanic/teichoic acid biosynthesis glycosyltransferase
MSNWYSQYIKRLGDIILSGLALVALSPVLIMVALLVRIKLGPAMIFCQMRPGKDGKPFMLFKFRTMTDTRDATGHLLPNVERMTPFGAALRRSSLDELPELWNVLRGDMSLVGPRPLLMQYLERYTPEQARRHEVRPGLTGWAQVHGRNAIGWDEKFRLDTWYVDNLSLQLDLTIIARTMCTIVQPSRGALSIPSEFKGQDSLEAK